MKSHSDLNAPRYAVCPNCLHRHRPASGRPLPRWINPGTGLLLAIVFSLTVWAGIAAAIIHHPTHFLCTDKD